MKIIIEIPDNDPHLASIIADAEELGQPIGTYLYVAGAEKAAESASELDEIRLREKAKQVGFESGNN